MGVPAVTARIDPVGQRLRNGYRTLVCFAADPNVSLWEKTVQPPGVDGGDPVDTNTMHNDTWFTQAARTLKKMTDGGMTVAYDPAVYDQIVALINVEGSVTIHFPDGSAVAFFGYLKSFEPGDNAEGEQPEATCVIVCTNTDPMDGTEADINYEADGT